MTPFPTEILPEPIRSYVEQAAVALDCDPAYVAIPMLPTLASAIGNSRRIMLKLTWTEPAIVWAAVVGQSGTVKSPALELATRPAWKRQASILREHARMRAEHDEDVEKWKAMPKSGRGEKPDPPGACEHPVCSDITVEALADRLLATPRGVLLSLDEMAAWFGSFNEYKSGGSDVAHWLSLHGGRALKVDRKTGDRPTLYIPHASVSVTGTIQPDALKRNLLPAYFENGLAARLLLASPPPRVKRWNDRTIDPILERSIDSLFEKLYGLRGAPGIDGQDEPSLIPLTDDAQVGWITFVNEHNEQLDTYVGADRASWAKLEAYAARFALILHCAVSDDSYVSREIIDAGITLARWFGHETLRVYRMMTQTPVQQSRSDLLDLINRLGGRVTPRQIKEHCRRYATSEQAEAALESLVASADGSWAVMRQPGGGRPATMFVLADSPDRPARPGRSAPVSSNSN